MLLLHKSLRSCCLLITSRTYNFGDVFFPSSHFRRTLTEELFRDQLASYADLFPWWNALCCCKRPSLAASVYPSHPCSVSNRLSTWIPVCNFAFQLGHSFVGDKWLSGPVPPATFSITPSWDRPRMLCHCPIGMWWGISASLSTHLSSDRMFPLLMLSCRWLPLHISWNDRSLPAPDCSPWLSCISSGDQFSLLRWIPMTLLTDEGVLVSWGPSPVDKTSMQKSTFHKPSSNQAIRIVSVPCCTLCPRLDGPFDHVNEREIRSGITLVTLLNYTCKGPCPLPCVYRLRFRTCSGTTDLFSSCKIASKSYSCFPLNLLCQVPRSRPIFSDCSSFCFFDEPLGGPTTGIWLSDTSLPRLVARSLSPEHGHRPSTWHTICSSKVLLPAQMAPDWYGRPYHVAVVWLGVSTQLSVQTQLRHCLL